MKILLQQGNNAAFNDNKRNQQSTQFRVYSNQRQVDIAQITQDHSDALFDTT